MKKKKRYSFFIVLGIVLATLVVVVFCGYLLLDKVIVPKYFKDYGIDNMHDLVAMVKTLYNSPNEEQMIKNGYKESDQLNAVNKLISAGVPTKYDGSIDYQAIAEGVDRDSLKHGDYTFTDCEIASLIDQMLESGVLAQKLPNIKYLDTLKINILDLIISPEVVSEEGQKVEYSKTSANVSFTFKLDTSAVRSQMAVKMDTPLFLLNMIVPKTMYITVNYKLSQNPNEKWEVVDGHLGLNGRTEKDSQILLDLLISFIFPEEDEMTIDKLTNECGRILITGLDFLGHTEIYTSDNITGVLVRY